VRRQLYAHLWTNAPAPPEYVDFILRRDIYHCTPSQLRAEKASDVLADLTCLEIETRVANARNRSTRRRASMS